MPEPLGYAKTLKYIRALENPYNKGFKNGYAIMYDAYTAGYGTDIRSHPELKKKMKGKKWTAKEARDQAVIDMRKHDKVIMNNLKKYTNRPDTISDGPRLLAAQARYHYGNIVKSFPVWAKAIVEGDANKQKEQALKLAKGYPDRYNKIKSIKIYE